MTIEESSRLRVAILTSDSTRSKYLQRLVAWVNDQSQLELVTLLVVDSRPKDRLSARLARTLIEAFDNIWLKKTKRHHDHLDHVELSSLPVDVIRLSDHDVSPTEHRSPTESPTGYIGLNLDLIVQWGDETTPTVALTSRLGFVSAGYPNRRVAGAHDAGFWETYRKEDATWFSVNHCTASGASPTTSFRESIQTRHYYLLTQACLMERSLHHLQSEVTKVIVNPSARPAHSGFPEDRASAESPVLHHAFRYIFELLRMRAAAALHRRTGREKRWGVSYSLTHWRDTVMADAHSIANPPGHFLADPFAIEVHGKNFCFVEDYDFQTQLGCITVYDISTGASQFLGCALEEDFHLSFPYLFKFQDALYMVPETSQKREIRVYRCTGFPLQWSLHKSVMRDVDAVDTMLFEHRGLWWMLTNIDPLGSGDFGSELHLFSADSPLDDEWVAHPMNPIVTDSTCARNGGILIEDGRLFRVSQRQGYDQYGKASAIHEIVRLDRDVYVEKLVRTIDATFRPGAFGTHHFFSTGKITTFDYVYRPTRPFGR